MIDNQEQREFYSTDIFRLISDAETKISMAHTPKEVVFRGSHSGYEKTKGIIHDREVRVDKDGKLVTVLDRLSGKPKKIQCCLPLAPGVQTRIDSDNKITMLAGDIRVCIKSNWNFLLQDGLYSPQYGVTVPTTFLVANCDGKLENYYIKFELPEL